MIRRAAAWTLALVLLLSGCAAAGEGESLHRYEASFLDVFDTVTTVVGYAATEEEFSAAAQSLHDQLLEYHRLYDIYNDYEGLVNLKTVNDRAGTEAVAVEPRLMDLLLASKTAWEETDGRVNAAMGAVLQLWHEAREAGINAPDQAKLPDQEALEAAAQHTDFADVVLDEAAGTVRFTDPELKLDVGAIAKGYAVEQVAREAPAGLLLSVGGNVCATGPKADGSPWVVGIENPDGGDFLQTLYVEDLAVVTSGDYQRYYTVDGVRYHHIIDPDTLYPSTYWRSVTVLAADSGVADCLSTALFTLPQAEGQQLLDRFDAEAMWVDAAGNKTYSPGFSASIRT